MTPFRPGPWLFAGDECRFPRWCGVCWPALLINGAALLAVVWLVCR